MKSAAIEVSLRLPCEGEHAAGLPALVEQLQCQGIAGRQIQVLSREPLAAFPASRSPMSKLGIAGALFGFCGAIAGLVVMTLDYRVHTGGMPLIAPFPLGVIAYEMTLLGSILAMLLTLFISARLGPGRRVAAHPELEYGEAILSVHCEDRPQALRIRELLARLDYGRDTEVMK